MGVEIERKFLVSGDAWRTLGEALLLIDMYEHQSDPPSDLQDRAPPRKLSVLQRASAWFRRWRR